MLDWLRQWFDPDRRWWSVDKWQHAAAFALVAIVLLAVDMRILQVVACANVIAIVFELGQTDVARSEGLLGQEGYGIGIVDLVWDNIGLAAGVLAWWLVGLVL